MKTILASTILMCTMSCFAQERTLYDENGLTFGYKYEKIGTTTDNDCPNVVFDEYQIIAKVENKNSKAINLNALDGRLRFSNDVCTKTGNLQSNVVSYESTLFLPHHSYGTATPNTGFAAAHTYFLDPHDEYATTPSTIKVVSGNSFPEPEWNFPKWSFVNITSINDSDNNQHIPLKNNTNYKKLIIGKWLYSQSSTLKQGKEIDIYSEEDACFDSFLANNQMMINIGDCNNGQEAGKWSLTGNILQEETTKYGKVNYEILDLDNSILKLKLTEGRSDGSFSVLTYKRAVK